MTDAQEQSILTLIEQLMSVVQNQQETLGYIVKALKEIGVTINPDVKQNQI